MAAQPTFVQSQFNTTNIRPNQGKKAKKRQWQHSADIVFAKGTVFQRIPSLGTLLEEVTECIIGLQYVWEYRSPSKSVPPHYQCKLCAVCRLQRDMLAHVKGWKHCYRYLKKAYPDRVPYEEEEVVKDAAIKKFVKEAGTEVESTEGRGILKVILKEPSEVLAFKDLPSAIPKRKPLPPHAMGPMGPMGQPFSENVVRNYPRFSEEPLGDFPPQDGPFSDYLLGDSEKPSFGGYLNRLPFLGSKVDQRPFPDSPSVGGFRLGGGGSDFGRSSLQENNPSRMYPDYLNRPMDNTLERPDPCERNPGSSSLSSTLLRYLETFQIENESDAQLVLKVTQKLTDLLMAYRLRGLSKSSSLSSTDFSPPSRMSGNNRYSGPSNY